MRVLVAVASKHGSTRGIAEAIAKELRTQHLSVDLIDAAEINGVAGYDAVILGSAIYAGRWLPEARNFAEGYQTDLAKVPVWVFSSGPLGEEDPQPLDDKERLAAPLGNVNVRDHHVFVGKLDPETLGLAERMIVKAFKSPEGDFRDWEDIRGWAHDIGLELLTERAR